MTDFKVVPPTELDQCEAEITLGRLVWQLREAMAEKEEAAQEAARNQSRLQSKVRELQVAVSAYRARLGLQDIDCPVSDLAERAKREKDLLSRAIPADQLEEASLQDNGSISDPCSAKVEAAKVQVAHAQLALAVARLEQVKGGPIESKESQELKGNDDPGLISAKDIRSCAFRPFERPRGEE